MSAPLLLITIYMTYTQSLSIMKHLKNLILILIVIICSVCNAQNESASNTYDKVVYLPTAFSPNNDGMNDHLFIRGKGIEALELSIYNRFGELVFMTKDQSIGWDGYYEGEKLNSEVYIANLNVTFIDGEEKQLFGNITLVL